MGKSRAVVSGISYLMIKQFNLKSIRLSHGLIQSDIASLIGISRRMYQYYEHGKRIAPKKVLELLEYKLNERGGI